MCPLSRGSTDTMRAVKKLGSHFCQIVAFVLTLNWKLIGTSKEGV